ncbi:hypothetical protein F6P62_10365 [Streptococcus suis]|nr:hypothetical protein [Streptococcus suis]
MELYSLSPSNKKEIGFYLLRENRRRSLYLRTFGASLILIMNRINIRKPRIHCELSVFLCTINMNSPE